MTKEEVRRLLEKYMAGLLTREEYAELLATLQEKRYDPEWQEMMDSVFHSPSYEVLNDAAKQQFVLKKILTSSPFTAVPVANRVHFLRRWKWAAVILVLLGSGAYLWTTHKNNIQPAVVAAKTIDIAPGTDGAILTLADGSQIVLDSLGNGLVAAQKGAQVLLQNGQLAYNPTGETAGEILYNTLNTPKGRQFQLVLPDGTRVWLNAASSLRYPTVFSGKERKVEVSGEAYFEVAKNAHLPFRVQVDGKAEVEVLGTHFNVNAYGDEGSINTTLMEGLVKVNGTEIHPGQQARVPTGSFTQSGIKIIDGADMAQVLAWKNGIFHFGNTDLRGVMKQLERWYDIDVRYEGALPVFEFWGDMDRGVMLSTVLRFLSEYGVHTRLEGNTLTVSGNP